MKLQFNLKTRIIVSLLVVGGISATYQNCSKVAFTETTPSGLSADGSPTLINPTPSNPAAPGTAVTIRQFQPALAVRDISCLACHANIKANVVTDFGYGNSWYINQNGDQASYGNNHYLPTSWQSIDQVQGQIIVPVANVPDASVMAGLASGALTPQLPMSIAEYLSFVSIKDWSNTWTYSFWGRPAPANLALTTFVAPVSGTNAVAEQNFVYIGAPTSNEILSIVPNTAAAPWIQQVGATSTGLTGLSIVAGSGGSYVTNSGSFLDCSGKDVVINGTLLLKNLNVMAENNGCRLYVTGSVFIEGPITYINSGAMADPTNNLQITSSTSIIMGVGIDGVVVNGSSNTQSNTPLHERLLGDVRSNLVMRSAQTSSAYSAFAQSILKEGLVIGTSQIPDASVANGMTTAKSAAGQTRVKIDFQHLLLNAPLIHSRYLGTVKGVIVAESAEFSLGEFSFNFDPVFQTAPVLPALPQDILCAVSAMSKCNPAQL